MRPKSVAVVGIMAFAVGLITGAAIRGQRTATDKPVLDRRYALNVAYSSAPFWNEAKSTSRKIGSVTPGLETVFGGPPDADASKQIEELEALIARKVSGIVVFPSDERALVPAINKATTSGIPVVTIFSDVKSSKRLAFIGAPERESSRAIAEGVFAEIPGFRTNKTKAKVLIVTDKKGNPATEARLSGIEEVLNGFGDKVEVVATVYDDNNVQKGSQEIAAILQKNKDIKVIFGLDGRSAICATTALRDLNRSPDSVIVTGWDSDNDVLEGIKTGAIHSTSVLNSSFITQIGLSILEGYRLGYLYPETLQLRELDFPPVPDAIEIKQTLVNRKNVEGYLRKK